jgi:hypothetical protein
MIGRKATAKPVTCVECGTSDRFVLLAQQVSVDSVSLTVRVERVIVVCAACQQATEITRDGSTRYRGTGAPGVTPPAPAAQNGPVAEPEDADTDLPARFKKLR